MAFDREWKVFSATLTANGGTDGTITVASTAGLYTHQTIQISGTALTTQNLVVREVLSSTQARLGLPVNNNTPYSNAGVNLSAYTTAASSVVYADKQNKHSSGSNSAIENVYEQMPVVALRVLSVDTVGNPVNSAAGAPGNVTISNASITTTPATAAASTQVGTLGFAAITGTNVGTANTIMTLTGNAKELIISNSNNNGVSIAIGASEAFRVGLTSPVIPLYANGSVLASGSVLKIFLTGSASTAGEISITAVY